jgi:RNA polymerase sigma factor (sigma-70 family)
MELEHVFRDHQKAVYVYFLRLVGDAHQAEELTQETFYRACLAALRFRGDSSVTTWLFGIAHRVFLEFLRTKRNEVGGELPDLATLTPSRTRSLTWNGPSLPCHTGIVRF